MVDYLVYQLVCSIGVIYVGGVVSFAQHLKPYFFVHEVIDGACGLDYVSWRAGSCAWLALVGEELLEQLPAQLKLE